MTLLTLLAGLVLLILGGDLLVRGASRLAAAFGIPSLIIGLTVAASALWFEFPIMIAVAVQRPHDALRAPADRHNAAGAGALRGWRTAYPSVKRISIACALPALPGAESV